VRADDLFVIDVAAEVATLCGAQLQGPWQVPAEFVRLANGRGSARVEIDRARGGFWIRCDGVLASPDELRDLDEIFSSKAPRSRRQSAIGRIEAAGLSALLWASGLPGARLMIETTAGDRIFRFRAREGSAALADEAAEFANGPARTRVWWRCRGLRVRRAVAWLRTALRFVPIPVSVCGRPVERGFPNGLYRMKISHPLPGEIAVTATGDAPHLWLLENGVLSARAVVPGYPAFSAAVEMNGVSPPGSSADELRAAVNPHLDRLIDEVARMLLLLVDRLVSADESVRRRLATLLLRTAALDLRRDAILSSAVVSTTENGVNRMTTPLELQRVVMDRGGIVAAREPGSRENADSPGLVVTATAEERSLLADLLSIRIERRGAGGRSTGPFGFVVGGLRRCWRALRAGWGTRPLDSDQLTPAERRLVRAACDAGVDLALSPGFSAVRIRRSTLVVGRERTEVRAAAAAVADGSAWLYPALLAVAGDLVELPDEIAVRWLEGISGDAILDRPPRSSRSPGTVN
jgi:hypothetical protein